MLRTVFRRFPAGTRTKPDRRRNFSRLFPTFSTHPDSRKRQAVKEEERGGERHITHRRKNHCVQGMKKAARMAWLNVFCDAFFPWRRRRFSATIFSLKQKKAGLKWGMCREISVLFLLEVVKAIWKIRCILILSIWVNGDAASLVNEMFAKQKSYLCHFLDNSRTLLCVDGRKRF